MWKLRCVLVLVGLSDLLVGAEHAYRHHAHDVHLAAFFPETSGFTKTSIGQGVMPAVRLAIKHVNRDHNVLPHHRVKMHWSDTMCNPGVGLKSLFDMVNKKPKKVILFGGACSNVTDQIVKAARHWNLVQVTYADTHPMFTARSFPHFFRVVPSENQFNEPRLAILKEFNWTRVGTLYQNEAKYSLAHNDLIMELEKKKFEVVISQSFNDELTGQIEAMVKHDVRIILGNFNESWARAVFCDAYNKGVYGAKFQWLVVGMYDANWWNKSQDDINCTPDQILEALNGTLVLEIQPISSQVNVTTISGKTPLEYEEEYRAELKNIKKSGKRHPHVFSRFHGYAYDGIWAISLAIEKVEEMARQNNQTILDFQYQDPVWEERFIRALNHTSFQGVTGPVQFKDNTRLGNILINQIIDGKDVCVGEYSGVTRTLHMERCQAVTWDRVPKDRTVERIEQTRVNFTIYTILVITATLGIILGFGFLAVNIKYRHQKQIKMSSPNLNNLIIIGCVLSYTSVIILGLDSTLTSKAAFPYICAGKAWVLMAGFTLSFGSMFSKTWRVHSIFTNVQLNKKVMKDSQLFLIVGILLAIDIVIMTTWQIFDPFRSEYKKLRPYSSPEDLDVQIVPRNEMCKSTYMHIFVLVIYAYKGLLMIFGAFLAWETRNVQIPALNDSKYVGMSVYNVVIMCVLGVAISYVLNEDQNASFIIISVFIIFCTTGTLCLVFVPKVIELRRDPLGVSDRNGKPHIKAGGNKLGPSALQSLDDRIKIASKVKSKYLELRSEKNRELMELQEESGDDYHMILAQAGNKPQMEKNNELTVTSRQFEIELSSEMSERPSSNSDTNDHQNTQKHKPSPSTATTTTSSLLSAGARTQPSTAISNLPMANGDKRTQQQPQCDTAAAGVNSAAQSGVHPQPAGPDPQAGKLPFQRVPTTILEESLPSTREPYLAAASDGSGIHCLEDEEAPLLQKQKDRPHRQPLAPTTGHVGSSQDGDGALVLSTCDSIHYQQQYERQRNLAPLNHNLAARADGKSSGSGARPSGDRHAKRAGTEIPPSSKTRGKSSSRVVPDASRGNPLSSTVPGGVLNAACDAKINGGVSDRLTDGGASSDEVDCALCSYSGLPGYDSEMEGCEPRYQLGRCNDCPPGIVGIRSNQTLPARGKSSKSGGKQSHYLANPAEGKPLLEGPNLARRQSCPGSDYEYGHGLGQVITPPGWHSPAAEDQEDDEEGMGGRNWWSSCSLESGELHCSAEAEHVYYRYEDEGYRASGATEDQATQTDDEAEMDTPKRPKRPTSFKTGVGAPWSQVRSQEELFSNDKSYKKQMCGEMRGTGSQKAIGAPIFQVSQKELARSSKLVSCPNISVKCDIVEYL